MALVTIRTDMITNENLEIFSRFRFRNGTGNNFLQIFFRICFRNELVGHAHAPRTGHTYEKNKIPEFVFRFRFRNPIERKSRIPGFLFFFAYNCFRGPLLNHSHVEGDAG